MNKIAIVGASGHGKVVAELAEQNGFDVVFYDDAHPNKKVLEHWPVIGKYKDLLCANDKYKNAIVAIGNNQIRLKFSKQLVDAGFTLPVLIHPKAVISKSVDIASGTVVFANVVINAFAKIGHHCIINTGAIIEHDCVLGNGVHISPNSALAGGTKVDDLAWLGIGTVTCQLVHIGKKSTIGANSTVTKNIPAGVIAFGSPAVVKDFL